MGREKDGRLCLVWSGGGRSRREKISHRLGSYILFVKVSTIAWLNIGV